MWCKIELHYLMQSQMKLLTKNTFLKGFEIHLPAMNLEEFEKWVVAAKKNQPCQRFFKTIIKQFTLIESPFVSQVQSSLAALLIARVCQ